MEVAPRYMLLTLLTLLSVDMVYTIDTIQNALHCLNSSIMLLACMPVYIVREVEWTGVDTPSKGSKDCYDYYSTCSAINKTFYLIMLLTKYFEFSPASHFHCQADHGWHSKEQGGEGALERFL